MSQTLRFSIVTLILIFSVFTLGGPAPGPDTGWSLETEKDPQQKNSAQFNAPLDHHFNKEAPNKAETLILGKWVKSDNVDITGSKLIATWKGPVDFCNVKATLFICDDKNTYCLPRTQEITCKSGKKDKTQIVSTEGESTGDLTSEGATALARQTHKPLMIEFYGIWCPPCNQLNEAVFNRPDFKKISENFIFLRLDSDKSSSWNFKAKYKIKGYPTVIFTNETGSEISRIVGARDLDFFVNEMKNVLKKKREKSFDSSKELADRSGDPDAAYRVGLIYLDREEFEEAHYYLTKASRGGKSRKGDLDNKLLTATLGIYAKLGDSSKEALNRYVGLLKDSLVWYPHVEESLDRGEELAKFAANQSDSESQKKGLLAQINYAEYYLKHKGEMKKIDATVAGLYEIEGDAYSELNEKVKSQESFEKASAQYYSDIRASAIDENKERAYNLERIYCIWKSGKVDLANNWYDKLEKVYPDEFTFYYQHAKLLQDQKKFREASEKATRALEFSYGDNKLRVVGLLADLFGSLNEKDRALEVLNKGIAQAELPADKTIRSYRYYKKLLDLKKKFSGS